MNVREAHRVRHVVVRLDQGDELPAALVRALDEAGVRSGWITGVGALETAELVVYDQRTRSFAEPRRIEGPCEVVSISGNVACLDGATTVRLSAVLARETDRGLETFGGQFIWGRAFALELVVMVFEDLALVRAPDERTGLPAPEAAPVVAARPVPAAPPAAVAIPAPVVPVAVALPSRPEAGDRVVHFHFGECDVLSVDGDRARLRPERDGRVREVALTMLKVEAPTTHDGRRMFKLNRKN